MKTQHLSVKPDSLLLVRKVLSLVMVVLLLLQAGPLFAYQVDHDQSSKDQLAQKIVEIEKLHKKGAEFQGQGAFDEAFKAYQEAEGKRELLFTEITELDALHKNILLEGAIKGDFNRGVAFTVLMNLEKAEAYLKKGIEKYKLYHRDFGFSKPERLARLHYQLGKVYTNSKGLEEARTQFQLAKHYFSHDRNVARRHISNLENAISNLFLKWEEPESLYIHSLAQYKLLRKSNNPILKASPAINLGVSMEMMDKLDSAELYFLEALESYRIDSIRYANKIEVIYHNMSFVYSKKNMFRKALEMEKKAIEISDRRKNSLAKKSLQSKYYNNQGLLYYDWEKYHESINSYNDAIHLNSLAEDPLQLEQHLAGIGTSVSPIILNKIGMLNSLGYQAKSFAGLQQYQEAQSAFTLAINYLNKIRREYNDTESKLKLTEIAKVIFEGAIALHLDPVVNEPEKAFAYAEQSKAFTLLEGIKHSKAMRIAKVPEELLEREYELRGEIARLERKYLAAEEPEEKTEHLQAIRQHKEELTGLLNRLQRNKEYRKLMSFEAPSRRQLQRKALDVGQTLVEYFVGEEKTYVFVLPKKGKLKVLQLDLDSKGLNQQVDEFWSSIYHYGCDEDVLRREAPELLVMGEEARKKRLQERYLTLGQSLYTQLFQPIVDLGVGTRFVIVPDEGLSYLPFDALLMGEPEIDNFSFYPYLGRAFTLSYAYSGNLLLEVQQGRGTKAKKILAMAPSFSSRQLAMNKSALSRLTNNVTEINAICDIFSNQCAPLKGMAANLEAFRNLVEQNAYRIIHLSTHGKANDKNPNQSWISFTQNREQLDETQLLYASDLYALPIQADLVVLSACETNKGRLRRGEGIMSFARGFSAAGVKSVLSTFWVIGEDPSLLVMKDFYEQLNNGAAKDEALQKARLGLMENSDFSHPFYWSAFVPIGQMAEVEAGGSGRWLVGVLLLLLAFWIFRHLKSRSLLMSEN